MYLGEEPRTTPQVGRCSSTSPGDFPPIYCILKHGHDGGHIGADGGEWFSSSDTPLVQRLETGIAATVREIDELRAENTRLRKLIDGVAAVLGVHITIGP